MTVLVEFLIIFFICWLMAPFITLLHELGHAFGLLLATKDGVAKVYLGNWNRSNANKESLRIGKRLFLYIKWGHIGYCAYHKKDGNMTKYQFIFFLLCGPLSSLLITLSLLLSLFYTHSFAHLSNIIIALAILNFTQFLFTIMPLRYPGWMKGYKGMPSDGYGILWAFKNQNH